jgi:hypothetical protein
MVSDRTEGGVPSSASSMTLSVTTTTRLWMMRFCFFGFFESR